jgi:TRAP-type C4-dicarboxylate transport system permease small subunit
MVEQVVAIRFIGARRAAGRRVDLLADLLVDLLATERLEERLVDLREAERAIMFLLLIHFSNQIAQPFRNFHFSISLSDVLVVKCHFYKKLTFKFYTPSLNRIPATPP